MKRLFAGTGSCCLVAAVALTLVTAELGWAQVHETPSVAMASEDQAYAGEADQSMKEAMAESILAERESRAGRAWEPAYRHSLRRRLASRSIEDLRAWLADPDAPIPGGASADLTYTTVDPCRIIDTRVVGAGGAIAGGTRREFFVAGNEGFGSQGGNAAGCRVPLGPATAVMLNIVATASASPGFLTAFAWASPAPPTPFAAVLNYGVVSGLSAIANGIAVPICDQGSSCSRDLFVYASSTTHVVVDVVGYFSRPDANALVDLVTKSTQTISAPAFTELLQSDIVLPDKCVGTADGWTVLVMASGYGTLSSVSLNALFGLSVNDGFNIAPGSRTVVSIEPILFSFSAWHTQWVFTGLDAGAHAFRTLAGTGGAGSYFVVNSRMVVQVLGNSCP